MSLWSRVRRSRLVGLVFFICVLILLVNFGELAVLSYLERSWDIFSEARSTSYLTSAEQAFSDVQRATRRIGTEIASNSVVHAVLLGRSSDSRELFSVLSKVSRDQSVGIEVYNNQSELVAWEGSSGQPRQREIEVALKGRLTSYVNRMPIYSQLFVTVPVRTEGKIIGAVLVRRVIEVHYPLDKKFISTEGLSHTLSDDLGVSVEYDFSEYAEPRKDGRYVSAILYGIDSTKLGVVSVARPVRSGYLENIGAAFRRVNAGLLAALLGVLGFAASRVVSKTTSVVLRSLAMTGLIWSARYMLLWMEVPSSFFATGIFDAVYFASEFGGGLAKSIGEMTLTSIALGLNTGLLAHYVLEVSSERSPWWYPRHQTIRITLALVTIAGIFLLLRGYAAVIRSAVNDSTMMYSDPKVIVPSFELAMMVFNLFVISFCLIIVVAGGTSFLLALFSRVGRPRWRAHSSWIITAVLFTAGAVVFGMVYPTPLTSFGYRLFFGVCMLAFTYYLHLCVRRFQPIPTLRNFLIALGLSGVFFYPLLDENVHEKDRDRVEVFAAEVLRPADSWLKHVVEESLERFTTDQTVDVLIGGRTDEIEGLAFTNWARSLVSREGYDCLFAMVDPEGHTLSVFTVGGQGTLSAQANLLPLSGTTTHIQVSDVGSGVNAMKVYAGSVPIRGPSESVIAHARVVISAGTHALFRGERPVILRSYRQENLETFYRPIAVSEFHAGVLHTTNNNVLPVGYRLPDAVIQELRDSSVASYWVDEVISEKTYESIYVRPASAWDPVVSLSLQKMDLPTHLYNIVKVVFYYAIVVIVVLITLYAVKWIRGNPYESTFRDKLLVALFVTALVPIVIIALYGRMYARERLLEITGESLEQETAAVGVSLARHLQSTGDASLSSVSASLAEEIASDMGTDFNLHVGAQLKATSRPELYEAGILDRRLSGSAYANVTLMGKRFHLQTENIGRYQYAVGYRALIQNNGQIAGVVSVPTLYRQDEIDAEVAQRNALLFGVYAFVVLAITGIATAFANRIAGPIHRLTEATKRVSQGDLDVDVPPSDAEGEVGELIRSFGRMTKDLKRSREHLVQYERELAWKEMAKQVAHEIKNPLTPMKLAIQHLRQTHKDKVPEFHRVLDEVTKVMIDQIDALSRIASEFSHFARMPSPHQEVCDVNEILAASVRLFDQQSHIQFVLENELGLPPVLADREELGRAFVNIVRNAVQAMEHSGHLTLSTRKENGFVIVEVRDCGIGIPDDMKEKLFEPNFSTKTDGMGLGLAIVKKTIDDLGGTISIESTVGVGTTVVIKLPVATS